MTIKQAWILISIILFSTLPIQSVAIPIIGHKKQLEWNLWGQAHNHTSIQLNRAITNSETIGGSITTTQIDNNTIEGTVSGIGIHYRNFADLPHQGFFYGIGAYYNTATLTQNKGTENETKETAPLYSPYYEIGYIFSPLSPVTFGISLLASYTISKGADISFPYNGLYLYPKFTVHYPL